LGRGPCALKTSAPAATPPIDTATITATIASAFRRPKRRSALRSLDPAWHDRPPVDDRARDIGESRIDPVDVGRLARDRISGAQAVKRVG
jgi:hypothetical protein